MFDVGLSELMVIAVVALVVIGPERLPKVARTAGLLLGRLQRYVSDVKSDINREIIVLKDIQGLPLEDIAGMLELPLGTVKSRSSRARVELARAIVEIEGGPAGGPVGAEAVS